MCIDYRLDYFFVKVIVSHWARTMHLKIQITEIIVGCVFHWAWAELLTEQCCSLSSAAHPPRLIAHIRHQSRGALASARRYRHHRLRLLRLCNGADDDDDEEGGRHRTIKLLFLPNLASIFQNTIEMGPFSISLLFTFLRVLLFQVFGSF